MYSLRDAVADDAEAISAFMEHVILTCVEAGADEKAPFVANTRRNLDQWLGAPALSFHLAAWLDDELVGVVMVRDFWNLCHLFVAPRHQGHGLGRRLLESALAACAARSPRGCVRLNASRNAIGFYRHMGFAEVLDATPPYRWIQFERAV